MEESKMDGELGYVGFGKAINGNNNSRDSLNNNSSRKELFRNFQKSQE